MLKPRPKLGLPKQDIDTVAGILRRAIEGRTCVTATYNRGTVKLSPCILYERDDALFVDAVTVERDGQAPREQKLGAFRLSGLINVRPTSETFAPEIDVPFEESRYQGRVLASV